MAEAPAIVEIPSAQIAAKPCHNPSALIAFGA
jgi:hypothetical protein